MEIAEIFSNLKEKSPIVHNITNYVTVNDVANIILACGASPIMADDAEEVEEITAICQALNINIGTLNRNTVLSMIKAGKKAYELGHPLILDPVGAGASTLRTETAEKLLNEIKFSVVRCNISELSALMSGRENIGGVDAVESDLISDDNLHEKVEYIKRFAKKNNCVVAVTGAIDIVTDGNKTYIIRNGRKEMSYVTGTGCQLSGMMAAYIGANPDKILDAAAVAVVTMGIAGEIAYENMSKTDGNSTYRNRIIDAVYNMDIETLLKRGDYYEF